MLKERLELGDRVEMALAAVGINKELVEQIIGKPCGCDERQERLNELDRWARRVLREKLTKANNILERIKK